jgi:hypothetical protein
MIWTEDPNNTPVEKIWYSEDRKYRVTWRSQVQGVNIDPKYLACVQIEVDERLMWDLISRHRKLGPAQKACQSHAFQQRKLAKNPPKKKRQRHVVNRGVILKKVD